MAHKEYYDQVKYRPMILYYSEILKYHLFLKQQFMAHWQQQCYDPYLASSAVKHGGAKCITSYEFIFLVDWVGKSLFLYSVRTPYKLDCEFRSIIGWMQSHIPSLEF